MTIRTRLTLWYSAMVTLIIAIFGLTIITMNRISIIAILDQTLTEVANTVASNINLVPVGEFGATEPQILTSQEELFDKASVWIQVWQTHENGTPIEPRLVQESAGISPDDGMLHDDPRAVQVAYVDETVFNGTITRVASRPLVLNGALVGVVQVGTSVSAISQANTALIMSVGIAAAISIGVSVGLGMWIASRLLKPIERISETAASIVNADDLKKRLPVSIPEDEIGRLASVFNHTMERLENLFKVQQRFVGDVSHELRTPLTSILGNIEIIQKYGYDQESFEAVHREAERMSRMTNDLLLLARADNGELKVTLAPIDLDPVVLEIYEQAHILAKKRELKIVMGMMDEVRIEGNVDRLKQLLLNLVNNAIKFTPDGGSITLSCEKQGKHAIVEIRDTGIGMSKEDQARIFDRFYQADNSRTHRSDHDGAGLGLSIARWIAEAHKGTIDVQSEIGKGTTFRIVFPALERKKDSKVITKEWLGI
jgi:two-component system, OmpR family, sensor kinase